MSRLNPSAVDPDSVGDAPIEDLIARAGDLKGELVAFVQRPRFARQQNALLTEAAGLQGHLDEALCCPARGAGDGARALRRLQRKAAANLKGALPVSAWVDGCLLRLMVRC